jgi:flagellar basal body-associated protein FliL
MIHRSFYHRLFGPLAFLAAALLAVSLAGCQSSPTYEFDELDSMPAQDDLIEFSLGKYVIPIPLVRSYAAGAGPKRNRVEFSFELHALITGDYESELTNMWERHEGMIRDRVILVCRNATADELQEPEMATLKSHLTDAVQAELGSKRIRRLLISEVDTRQL